MNRLNGIAAGMVAATCIGTALPAQAAQAAVEVDWRQTPPASGRVVDGAVEVVAPEGGGAFPLVTIVRPEIEAGPYAVTGEVRYEDVRGQGYLEMWSVFPDGSRYFSRTLEAEGPLAALTGTSDWREFQLPFFPGQGTPPTSLEINVVLPGPGRVWVGPLRIGALDEGGWWSGRTGGVIGAFFGTTIGIVGALTGALVARGKARRFVLGTAWTLTALGVGMLVAGLVALVTSQPYAVFFTLLLGGVILTAVFGALIVRARRAFSEAELRRMRALDAH